VGRYKVVRTKAENELGPILRALREHRGMSVRALAKRTGVMPLTLYRIERGEAVPQIGTIQKVCFVLQYEAWKVVRRAETSTRPACAARPASVAEGCSA